MGGHVGFESWLERDQLMAIDFDSSLVGIASQPFWLHWTDEGGERMSHVPDPYRGWACDGATSTGHLTLSAGGGSRPRPPARMDRTRPQRLSGSRRTSAKPPQGSRTMPPTSTAASSGTSAATSSG